MVGSALIVAIGAQNAFVLRQGLRREYAWRVAAICALCDLLLVALGVAGMGRLLAASQWAMTLARWGGVAWLVWQAVQALGRTFRPVALVPAAASATGAGAVVLATLAVTLLNPHVYLDTLVMLGAIGAQQPSAAGFIMGAALASLLWFFGLAGAGHWLAPHLNSRRWWQVIDLTVALVMLTVAWQLAWRPL